MRKGELGSYETQQEGVSAPAKSPNSPIRCPGCRAPRQSRASVPGPGGSRRPLPRASPGPSTQRPGCCSPWHSRASVPVPAGNRQPLRPVSPALQRIAQVAVLRQGPASVPALGEQAIASSGLPQSRTPPPDCYGRRRVPPPPDCPSNILGGHLVPAHLVGNHAEKMKRIDMIRSTSMIRR